MTQSSPAPVVLDLPQPWLLPFRRLDALLADAVGEARRRFGDEAARDSFRGLYLTDDDATAALAQPFGAPLRHGPALALPGWDAIVTAHPGWAWLRNDQQLDDTELDIVLISLAPEADLRYERLYGYLQDDVNRRRPTVDLVLGLVTTSSAAKLAGRAWFATDAPLRRRRLVRLAAGDPPVSPPLLAHAVLPDPQIVRLLLGGEGPDAELATCCRWSTPDASGSALPEEVRRAVLAAGPALVVQLTGPEGSGHRAAAAALAGELGSSLMILQIERLPPDDDEGATLIERVFREADLGGAVLGVDGPTALPAGSRREEALLGGLAGRRGVTVLLDAQPWSVPRPVGLLDVPFGRPDRAARRDAWTAELGRAGVAAADVLGRELADRFSFGPGRIAAAVADAAVAAGAAGGPGVVPEATHVFTGARRQTSGRLATLARRIEPARTWSDVVLPDATVEQLRRLCTWMRLRPDVLQDWGFGQKLIRGKGISALFTGPPGTGKTTAAELLAGELGLDLFAVDLSSVVSKYIGETEKNLERIFTAAAEADAILMFDEADALFGKRSQVHDAHDRYANIETSYLLQRMEEYEGIAVLATNLRENLDEAFTRRLQFVVDFPFPDEHLRAGIWRVSFPPGVPLADDVDPVTLGAYRLSGAGIAGAALHAAYLAADRGTAVDAAAVRAAVRHEFQKAGRLAPDDLLPDEGS